MLGVIIAQLYRLHHAPSPDPNFGYFVLAKPISCILHVSAACVALLGSVRFFRQQHHMAIGKVRAGGSEIMIIGVYCLMVCAGRDIVGSGTVVTGLTDFQFLLALFAVHVGINIDKA